MAKKHRIMPFLWFDDKAEEAAQFYTSIFEDSRITNVKRYGEGGPGLPGSVMSVTFELEGQEFSALNGGPNVAFSPAISFLVRCRTQSEVDTFWARLSEGGQTQRCGWLTDKYGVSWQVVPAILGDLLDDEDSRKSNAVMEAMLEMEKLSIPALKRAYERA